MNFSTFLLLSPIVFFIGLVIYALVNAQAAMKENGRSITFEFRMFRWMTSHNKTVGVTLILFVIVAIWLIDNF